MEEAPTEGETVELGIPEQPSIPEQLGIPEQFGISEELKPVIQPDIQLIPGEETGAGDAPTLPIELASSVPSWEPIVPTEPLEPSPLEPAPIEPVEPAQPQPEAEWTPQMEPMTTEAPQPVVADPAWSGGQQSEDTDNPEGMGI